MVDREGRNRLALGLRRFAIGRISEWEWEEYLPQATKDKSLQNVADTLESEFESLWRDYRFAGELALTAEHRRYFARWVMFLRSDSEGTELPILTLLRALAATLLDMGLLLAYSRSRRSPEENARSKVFALWPFNSRCDLDEALSRPRFLTGK